MGRLVIFLKVNLYHKKGLVCIYVVFLSHKLFYNLLIDAYNFLIIKKA